jgi:hypothetical protein
MPVILVMLKAEVGKAQHDPRQNLQDPTEK